VTAVDGINVELGTGEDDVDRVGVTINWDWSAKWFAEGDWYLGGHWEIGGSYWDGRKGRTGTDSLGEFGVAPVFRLQRHKALEQWSPYLEFGVGPHVMTEDEIGDKDFSIEFAFGSHLGAGLRVGSRQQFEFGYRFQHLSNASLGDDNPGINFHLLRIGYRFR